VRRCGSCDNLSHLRRGHNRMFFMKSSLRFVSRVCSVVVRPFEVRKETVMFIQITNQNLVSFTMLRQKFFTQFILG
jgi:hypothetical protein